MYRVIVLFLFASSVLSAQTPWKTAVQPDIFRELEQPGAGSVSLRGEHAIRNLVDLHVNLNRKKKTFTGYRIQIFSGNPSHHSMEKLQGLKAEFSAAFPDLHVYLNYYDPDFKIRAGDFHNKLEGIPALKRIRYRYPSAYLVKMEIPVHDLLPVTPTEEEIPLNEAVENGQDPEKSEENSIF